MNKSSPTNSVKHQSNKTTKMGPPIIARNLLTEYDTSLYMISEAAREIGESLFKVENKVTDWRGELATALSSLEEIQGQSQNIADAITEVLAIPG